MSMKLLASLFLFAAWLPICWSQTASYTIYSDNACNNQTVTASNINLTQTFNTGGGVTFSQIGCFNLPSISNSSAFLSATISCEMGQAGGFMVLYTRSGCTGSAIFPFTTYAFYRSNSSCVLFDNYQMAYQANCANNGLSVNYSIWNQPSCPADIATYANGTQSIPVSSSTSTAPVMQWSSNCMTLTNASIGSAALSCQSTTFNNGTSVNSVTLSTFDANVCQAGTTNGNFYYGAPNTCLISGIRSAMVTCSTSTIHSSGNSANSLSPIRCSLFIFIVTTAIVILMF